MERPVRRALSAALTAVMLAWTVAAPCLATSASAFLTGTVFSKGIPAARASSDRRGK